MPRPTLVIVTSEADPHADAAIRLIDSRGSLYVARINSEDFLSNASICFEWDATGLARPLLQLRDSGRTVVSADVGWWRKPGPVVAPPEIAVHEAARIAAEEGQELFRTILAPYSNVVWLNDPLAMRAASPKLTQFAAARRAGLRVPESIVTNDAPAALAFARRFGHVVVKPLKATAFGADGVDFGLFAARATAVELEQHADLISVTPVFLQRELQKAQELRVTVVGDRVFACEISTPPDLLDWRVVEPSLLTHRLVDLPDALSRALRMLLDDYGLRFGAFDLVREPDGDYVFLEVNPNGQYLWIELLTGAPITSAVVELLEAIAERPKTPSSTERPGTAV